MNSGISKRNIITLAVAFVGLVLIGSLVFYILSAKNPYGGELQIDNLHQYTSGKKSDPETLKIIKNSLYEIVSMNSSREDISSNSIKDILIRQDSFRQEYDEGQQLHTVEFLVDIESVKQSYLVNYEWSDSDQDEDLDQYGIRVSCLPVDQLRFGDFKCVDESMQMRDSAMPYLLIDWGSPLDNYGNTITSQTQLYEIYFAEYQILGDYQANNKLTTLAVPVKISDVKRSVDDGSNRLSFNLIVDGKETYSVGIDYDNDRLMRIQNTNTGLSIERQITVN